MNHLFTIFLIIIFADQINGLSYDCMYFCKRGSCNPDIQGFNLKCEPMVNCYHSSCKYSSWFTCGPNVPYYGSISQCNQTECIPPFGCSLISESIATNSCLSRDSFCDKESACCNNDDNCNKLFSPCTQDFFQHK